MSWARKCLPSGCVHQRPDPRSGPASLSASLRSDHLWEKQFRKTNTQGIDRAQVEKRQFSPEKEGRVTAIFQSGAFSLLLPGSNCLFCPLNVLWPRCRKVVSAEILVLLSARVSTLSVLKELFPLGLNPWPRSSYRWRWYVVVPISPRTGDTVVRVSRDPYQLMMI